jgi:peptidoglycan lytic transglycosylase
MKVKSIKLCSCLRFGTIFAVSLTLLFLGGCASHRKHKPLSELTGYSESGTASYYAMKFQNRKTASGERFDNYSMTAAHKTLPFGTKVKVTNIRNNKSVNVTINDRGPYVKGRVIDLTRAAFAKIEKIDTGITQVKILVVN